MSKANLVQIVAMALIIVSLLTLIMAFGLGMGGAGDMEKEAMEWGAKFGLTGLGLAVLSHMLK